MKRNRLIALTLGLALLCSCTPKPPAPTPTPEPLPTPTATPVPEPVEVDVAMLKGPTGLGAAKLMEDDGMNRLSGKNQYGFLPCAEPTEAVALLTKGEADIAALPTNLASTLYHKTDGAIQLLALNTYGVLYILENGSGGKDGPRLRSGGQPGVCAELPAGAKRGRAGGGRRAVVRLHR